MRTKYGNTPTRMMNVQFRSKAEANHALWLESERQAGRVKAWEYEKQYDLVVEGKLVCRIIPDFTLTMPDGRIVVHEVKGGLVTQTPVWRLKKKLFEILYPHLTYKVFCGGTAMKNKVIEWD